MNEERVDVSTTKLKAELYKIIDIIDYFERMTSLPDCNNCQAKDKCSFIPEPGQYVRVNCPLWGKGSQSDDIKLEEKES